MKKILLFLFLIASIPAQAQHITLGLSSGASMNTVLYNRNYTKQEAREVYYANNVAPVYKVDVAFNVRKWQIGLSSGVSNTMVNPQDGYGIYYPCACSEYTLDPNVRENQDWRDGHFAGNYSHIPIKLFVNRTVRISHVELYGGLSAGLGFIRSLNGLGARQLDRGWKKEHGIMELAGVQTGFRYYVGKHFAFTAGAECDFVNMCRNNYLFTAQLIAGAVIRL